MNNPWFLTFSKSPRATHRLFCFPYAGGNAHLFRAWAPLLPASVELVAIQTPGKGSRMLEPACATVRELTEGLVPALRPLLAEKPFSFFGHSNGALVAFELACVLQERGLPVPQRLFLSASPAPWTRVFEKSYAAMSDDEFATMLKDLNGTPPELFEDRDLFSLLLPGLRADFSLAETYAYTRTSKLAVPASVYYGEHDEISETQVRAWQDQLDLPARYARIPGGHFFIHTHLDRLTELVRSELAAYDPRALGAVAAGG